MAEAEVQVAPTYFWWSAFNICFCCLPLGSCAIYYSNKVKTANEAGDIEGAKKASKTAMVLNILALICGPIVIVYIIYSNKNDVHN